MFLFRYFLCLGTKTSCVQDQPLLFIAYVVVYSLINCYNSQNTSPISHWRPESSFANKIHPFQKTFFHDKFNSEISTRWNLFNLCSSLHVRHPRSFSSLTTGWGLGFLFPLTPITVNLRLFRYTSPAGLTRFWKSDNQNSINSQIIHVLIRAVIAPSVFGQSIPQKVVIRMSVLTLCCVYVH